MKNIPFLKFILASIIPFALIFLFTVDIYGVYFGDGDYPFGSEPVSNNPIYASKNIYVAHSVLVIFTFLLTIVFAFKKNWRLFFLFFGLGALIIFFPVLFLE